MNNKHEANRTFYDRISSTYDLIADAGEHRARELGEQLLDIREGERVLEIGYGTGNSLLSAAKSVGSTGKIVGIDISDGMRRVASQKLKDAGLDARVQLDVGDAQQLPYADGQFNAVFLSFTLELFALDDIPQVLSEIHRVLQTGGRLGVVSMATVPDGETTSLLEKTYVWMHQHFPHIVDCQPINVRQFLTSAKFKISKSQDLEIWTMPVVAAVAIK